jgi:ubiquinone/menaquinone biosynthesis C-methylase UbiE
MLNSNLLLLKIRRRFLGLFNNLNRYKKGGERQAAFDLGSIAKDHLERYRFASQHLPHSGKIVDMACGVGYGSALMAQDSATREVTGVDIGPEAIEFANKFYKKKNNQFVNASATAAPFTDSSFDGAVCFETIEHVNEDVAVIKEFQRILKPGAFFLLSHPNEEKLPYTKERFPYHVRHYFHSEMSDILQNAGFEIVKVFSQPSKHEFVIHDRDLNGSFLIYLCQKKKS